MDNPYNQENQEYKPHENNIRIHAKNTNNTNNINFKSEARNE